MKPQRKHIVKIGYQHYATDSITAAADLIKLISKFQPAKWVYEDGKSHFQPDPDRDLRMEMSPNQQFIDPDKPETKPAPLSLPKPKRGTILCLCEKSYVAPRGTCPSCGLAFAVSHARTHDGTAQQTNLRIL